MQRPIITLTTDFGLRDSYVGVMKGIILGICPHAQLVDITHDIPPQDITAAALTLRTFVPFFPAGSIHLVVVDPGVGSARRALALQTPQAKFVGPDNGVFGLIWQDAQQQWQPPDLQAVTLNRERFWRDTISATFHGRDIFAPIAAHLACGVMLDELGSKTNTIIPTAFSEPAWIDSTTLAGQIVWVDHFGNCVSNIMPAHLEPLGSQTDIQVMAHGHVLNGIKHTYATVAPGTPLGLIGSSGYLEIALCNGNASEMMGLRVGETIHVTRDSSAEIIRARTAQQISPSMSPNEVASRTQSRGHILLVDDDQLLGQTLQTLLEVEGYTVEVACNGQEALERIDTNYDVFIFDLAMPDMDGLSLIKQCHERELDIPIIIMTGYGTLETAVSALQLDAYDYVVKPFEPMILLSAVARAAERQKLRHALEQRRHLETVSQTALTVRHEINNPLAVIMGLAQLHLNEPISEALRQDLETISQNARRISEALRRLTYLRKITLVDTGIGDSSAMIALPEELATDARNGQDTSST
jgi:S-adenosylmethionine hydrolase/DNA-binding response OmpR family regulator